MDSTRFNTDKREKGKVGCTCGGVIDFAEVYAFVKGSDRVADETYKCPNCNKLYRKDGCLMTINHDGKTETAIACGENSFYWR